MKNFFLSLALTCSVFSSEPRVSVITSVYRGEEFIEGFLADLERQTIFDECEFILINANSPTNEDSYIREFAAKYANVVYRTLDRPLGIYTVWNMAIQIAKGEYIMNANLDDRLSPDCLEVLADALDEHPDVSLVYSDYYETRYPNETFEENQHFRIHEPPEFSLAIMDQCFPGIHPMWRKEMHRQYGFFDEWFKAKGDYEMWLRAVAGGAKFLHVPVNTGLCYINLTGISHRKELTKQRKAEAKVLNQRWGHFISRAKREQARKK